MSGPFQQGPNDIIFQHSKIGPVCRGQYLRSTQRSRIRCFHGQCRQEYSTLQGWKAHCLQSHFDFEMAGPRRRKIVPRHSTPPKRGPPISRVARRKVAKTNPISSTPLLHRRSRRIAKDGIIDSEDQSDDEKEEEDNNNNDAERENDGAEYAMEVDGDSASGEGEGKNMDGSLDSAQEYQTRKALWWTTMSHDLATLRGVPAPNPPFKPLPPYKGNVSHRFRGFFTIYQELDAVVCHTCRIPVDFREVASHFGIKNKSSDRSVNPNNKRIHSFKLDPIDVSQVFIDAGIDIAIRKTKQILCPPVWYTPCLPLLLTKYISQCTICYYLTDTLKAQVQETRRHGAGCTGQVFRDVLATKWKSISSTWSGGIWYPVLDLGEKATATDKEKAADASSAALMARFFIDFDNVKAENNIETEEPSTASREIESFMQLAGWTTVLDAFRELHSTQKLRTLARAGNVVCMEHLSKIRDQTREMIAVSGHPNLTNLLVNKKL